MDFTTQYPSVDASIRILPFFKNSLDQERIKVLSGIQAPIHFEGKFKEVLILHHPTEARKLFLLGLGASTDQANAFKAFRSVAFQHYEKWEKDIHVELDHLPVEICYHAALGLELATYASGLFKTEKNKKHEAYKNESTVYIHHNASNANEEISTGKKTAGTMMNMMRLVDSPSNKKYPEDLASYAVNSAQKYGYQARIFHLEDLKRERLNALLAVGKGSANPPVFIQLEYKPEHSNSQRPQLGLVGKGITFDTGGISIKASNSMHYMKSDMGGAAAVIGAVELAARLQLDIHLLGIVPSAENSVDANSINPGDVIDSYSGKTIEVIDTDAEGRLILADGLAYLQKNYQPEKIIDLATLTGNCVMALGYSAAGMFTDNDEMAEALMQAGTRTHERVWRLPMWDDYKDAIQSDIADVKNYSGKPVAGAIMAAKFIQFFISEHPAWAHLDIAGVAFGDSEFTKMKSATGYGIRLLVQYMKQLIGEKI